MRRSVHNRWRCASLHDPSGRRGIWYRVETEIVSHGDNSVEIETPKALYVEIVAGREGNDESVYLEAGQLLTSYDINRIVGVLACGAWGLETAGVEAKPPSVADEQEDNPMPRATPKGLVYSK